MRKFISKRKKLVIAITVAILLVGSGAAYYLIKGNPFSADTVVKRNTSCVIKVVDKDTGKPVAHASAIFVVLPNGGTSNSDENGCVALPKSLGGTSQGSYYQVLVTSRGYQSNLVHLVLSASAIKGERSETSKLVEDSSGQISVSEELNSETKKNSLLADVAQASDDEPKGMDISVRDALKVVSNYSPKTDGSTENTAGAGLDGASVKFRGSDGKTLLEGFTDKNGVFKRLKGLQVSNLRFIEMTVENKGYQKSYEYFDAVNVNGEYSISTNVDLWPILSRKLLNTYIGQSKISTCKGQTPIKFSYIYNNYRDNSAENFDPVVLQENADFIASIICALKQSDPKLEYIPIPDIEIANTNNLYLSEKITATAYADPGKNVITLSAGAGCYSGSTSFIAQCRSDRFKRFSVLAHEYGHLLDLSGTSWNKTGASGRFSYDDNLISLYSLIMDSDIWGKSGSKYYTTNTLEFWAESFALWMEQSFDQDLKLDLKKPRLDSFFTHNESKFTPLALNTFKFWKKFMATTLGSYCHPSIFDDNGRKTGATYTPPWGINTFVMGGPLVGDYSPEAILAGTATNTNPASGKGTFKVIYKKLPAGYSPNGMTIGVAPSCEVGAQGSANYRTCSYGPFSITKTDTEAVLKTQDVTETMPLGGLSKYKVVASYYCPGETPLQAKTKILKPDITLSTQENSYTIPVDFSKFPACPTTKPNMPPARR